MKAHILLFAIVLTLAGCLSSNSGSHNDSDSHSDTDISAGTGTDTDSQTDTNTDGDSAPTADSIAPELLNLDVEMQTSQVDGIEQPSLNFLVTGQVTDNVEVESVQVELGTDSYDLEINEGRFSQVFTVVEGTQTLVVIATDSSNNQSSQSLLVVADITPPEITNVYPDNGHGIQTRYASVKGMVGDSSDIASVVVTVAEQEYQADVDEDGRFGVSVWMQPGLNTYTIEVTDAFNNITEVSYSAYYGKQVSAGNSHTAFLKNGQLYLWGRNNYGQTGLGFVSDPNRDTNVDLHPFSPSLLSTDTLFDSVFLDQNTTLALDTDGQVWAWGYNRYGQLGQGTPGSDTLNEEPLSVPTLVPGITDAVYVTRGYDHSLVLHQDGSVSAFGRNRYGQLGDGTTEENDIPTKIQNLPAIVQIDAGSGFVVALDEDGRLWSWGRNNNGQLGLGTIDSEAHTVPVQIPVDVEFETISLGKGHALALAKNGDVYGWGLNFSSQVGNHDSDSDDPVWPGDVSSPRKLPWFENVRAVWANGNQSFVEREDGRVYPWGQNMMGTLGIEQDDNILFPASPVFGLEGVKDMGNGALHTIALRADGNVFTWGWSFQGSLGGGEGTIGRWSYRVPILVSIPEAE